MRYCLLIILAIGTFSCGSTRTVKLAALMDQKITDSVQIIIQFDNCISLKGKNNFIFHLKNISHSSLTLNTNAIFPGLISDSAGNNIPGINRVDYSSRQTGFITLEPGEKKEISYKVSYFSNYDLKKGQPYYVH